MKEQMLKLAGRVFAREVEKNAKAGPPNCYGFLHQPMRPERAAKSTEKEK